MNKEKRAAIEKELHKYGDRIMDRSEFAMAMEQRHHRRTSVGEHTLRVAVIALSMTYILHKLHVRVENEDVVTGALCHDLGMLGRNEKYGSDRECHREHPKESVEIAREIVPDLNENTEHIIRDHMWPLAGKRPHSKECVIVSAADKIASVRDFIPM